MKLPTYKNKDICIEYCRFSPSIESGAISNIFEQAIHRNCIESGGGGGGGGGGVM